MQGKGPKVFIATMIAALFLAGIVLYFGEFHLRGQEPEEVSLPGGTPLASMVFVPAGEFWMGCNEKVDAECWDNEKPGRTVKLEAFWIDRTETTVAQYRKCVEAGGCSGEGLTMPHWEGKDVRGWAWACNWGKPDKD